MNINTFVEERLNFIEVSNDLDLKAVFCDLGASIFNIYFHDEQMTRNVKDIKDFKSPECYYGKTVGRTSGRLKGYRFDIHDQIYNLEPNENNNVLHGGLNGLSNKVFKAVVNKYDDYVEVVFTYYSPHLEAGYPGNVDIQVRYLIWSHINRVDIRYDAKSDMDTLFRLTNHSYFSLGDENISNLELQIKSHRYLKLNNDDLLPVKPESINDVMDFYNYKKISQDIDDDFLKGKKMNGYDNFWYFDDPNEDIPNVSLRNDRYQLDILASYPGVVLYSSNFEPNFDLNNKVKYRDSVALEPSDDLNQTPVLIKDRLYHRSISYIFSKKQ